MSRKYVVRGIGPGEHASHVVGLVREGDLVTCDPEVAKDIKWLRPLPGATDEEPGDEELLDTGNTTLQRLVHRYELTSTRVLNLGETGLVELDGIAESRAAALLDAAREARRGED